MKFSKIVHKNVKEDGTFIDRPGAVDTNGGIVIINGNCGTSGCHCSDGYFISIFMPRTEDGIVEGIKIQFSSRKEMINHLEENIA